MQLSPIGVATHCLEIRDASPDLRASRSRGGPRSGSNFFDMKRVTLERGTNEVVFHTVLIVLIRGEASLIATLLYLLRERSVYAQPFKLTRSTVTRESSR